MFTSALVEGLETGEADRDQDGLVALDELYDYIYDKVRTATPNQTPGKWTFGVQGELFIARRARPVTVPAPLPPELQEAIDSPLAAVRAAAVQELARAAARPARWAGAGRPAGPGTAHRRRQPHRRRGSHDGSGGRDPDGSGHAPGHRERGAACSG